MTMVHILNPEQRWVCPNCPQSAVTREAKPHTRFHACAGLHGLTAPLVREGELCEIRLKVREDYIGDETVTMADGKPVMAVETVREDGNDITAYAPCVDMTGGIG